MFDTENNELTPAVEELLNNVADQMFTTLDKVPIEPKEYIFKPWFPSGKITLIPADPGTGKSKFTYGIIALITKGLPLLGVQCNKPGRVLVFSKEDSDTDIKKAVALCGGDDSQLIVPESKKEEALKLRRKYPITFSSQLLEVAIKRFQPTVVVFDPLQKYIGVRKMNDAIETSAAFDNLEILSEKYGCSFLIVGHTSKANYDTLAKRSLGSVDIVGNARSVLNIVPDPENPDELLAIHSKSNNKKGQTIRYKIIPIPGDEDFATVEFLGLEDFTERDLQKAIKEIDRREKQANITDDDAIVRTIIDLVTSNPRGIKVNRPDFNRIMEMVTGNNPNVTLDSIRKNYGDYLWDMHGIGLKINDPGNLSPFMLNGQVVLNSKPKDRNMSIYRGRKV